MCNQTFSSELYFEGDFNQTLFPLDTTRVLVSNFSGELSNQINDLILNPNDDSLEFLPQQRCYAAKHDLFVRRMMKLDPIAEYFLYDVVYRNRRSFRRDHRESRRSFGYRFMQGRPISATESYGAFRRAIWFAEMNYDHWVATDIATYFNCIYHHDLVRCVRDIGWADNDVEALGRFLRQINSGRSVDCVPQGIHPAKVLGAEFLRFLDNSLSLKSDLILRFQDDIHIFDNDANRVREDLLTLQALLGEKGLSINTSKTTFSSDEPTTDLVEEVETMRAELLQRRRSVIVSIYDDEYPEDDDTSDPLSEEQVRYLIGLLTTPDVEESDAELVLTLLRDHGEIVLPHLLDILTRFPGLSKNTYNYVRFSRHVEGVDELLRSVIDESEQMTEFQLFWLIKLAEDLLPNSRYLGDILTAAYEHPNATVITKAKVLEHPDKRYGLPELRDEQLRAGHSNWLAWASAVGTRCLKPASRNHVLGYFANGSRMNKVIADLAKQLPEQTD